MLDFSVHSKSINRFLYTPYSSYHSKATKKAFIKAELMRCVRNSSSLELFQETCIRFHHHLRLRGYPEMFLAEEFKQVSYGDRSKLLSISKNAERKATKQPHQDAYFKLEGNSVYNGFPWKSQLEGEVVKGIGTRVTWQLPPSLGKKLVRASL